jgi:hypothetical protein
MTASESVIFCEGYHDRAFLKGLLLKSGWMDLREVAGDRPVKDPFGRSVTKGQFGYQKGDRFLRVYPCDGINNVIPKARERLKGRTTHQLDRVLVSFDSDALADVNIETARGPAFDRVNSMLAELGIQCQQQEGVFAIDGGSSVIAPLVWLSPEPPSAHVPEKQTLERLVCASINAAYPERGEAVSQWLSSRPGAPVADHKAFNWSHMAGWYADLGCEAFLELLWRDESIAGHLRSRMEATGSWALIESLSQPPPVV